MIVEKSNVAVSLGPLGTVCGVQFAAKCQLLLVGFMLQVALPAQTAFSTPNDSVRTMAQDRRGVFMAPIMSSSPFESKADSA